MNLHHLFCLSILLITSAACVGESTEVLRRRTGILDNDNDRVQIFGALRNNGGLRWTYICFKVNDSLYTSAKLSMRENLFKDRNFENYVEGMCGDLCEDLCGSSHKVSDDNEECECLTEAVADPLITAQEIKDSSRTVDTCGTNAQRNTRNNKCECLPGYEGDADTECVDIDECLGVPSLNSGTNVYDVGRKVNPCGEYATCSNLPGSFKCDCLFGFSRPSSTENCIPSSCSNALGWSPCGPTHKCSDLSEGGYICEEVNYGYDNDSCAPIGCEPHANCINNKCECKAGYFRPSPMYPCMRE